MYKNNEPHEVIEFCLKHDLIKKTDQGYIIKKEFFEILDYFNIWGNPHDIKSTTKGTDSKIPQIHSAGQFISQRSHNQRIKRL